MIWRRLTNRVLRRGPDRQATDSLVESLGRYSVMGTAVTEETFRSLAASPMLASGTRLVAAVELNEPGMSFAFLTRIEGQGAAHSGRMRAIGAHLLLDRDSLAVAWSPDWQTALRATPSRSANELGPVRAFQWLPSDATDEAAVAAADRIGASDRVTRRVLGLLRDGSSGQFEIVPQGHWLRVAVYQYGAELPDPTALEALLSVARELTAES